MQRRPGATACRRHRAAHLGRVGREAADIGEAETLGGVAMAQRLAEELAGVEKDQRRPSIDGGLRLTNQKCEAPLYDIART